MGEQHSFLHTFLQSRQLYVRVFDLFQLRYQQAIEPWQIENRIRNVLLSDLPRKIIQATKEVRMYLLQAVNSTYFDICKKGALKKGISLGFAFPIYSLIAVDKLFDKSIGLCAWKSFAQRNNSSVIEHIGQAFFTIGC